MLKNVRILNHYLFFNAFRENIPGQALGMLAVFNGLNGTAADTGHTVCAAAAPHRLSFLQMDIFQGTDLFTFAAGYAGIGGIKFSGMYKCGIKYIVYDTAV